jgi:hypothetical protein
MHNVIFDEMPQLLETFEIDRAEIPKAMACVFSEWRKEVGPWATCLEKGEINDDDRTRAWATEENPGSHLIPQFDTSGVMDPEVIRKTFAPLKIAVDIRRAANPSGRITFCEGKIHYLGLTAAGSYLKSFGGTILAAGLPELVLKALRPDAIITRVNVEDPIGVDIQRIRVITGQSTTSHLQENPSKVQAICDDILRRRPLAPTLIICPKVVEEGVKTYVGDFAYTTHFGAIRGLDTWMHCEVFATIGDHYENIGAVDAEAEFFGVDAWQLTQQKLSCELEQAHGRARDCRREKPALHLHYGQACPGRWLRSNSLEQSWYDLTR